MSVVQARVAAFGKKKYYKQTDMINLYYKKMVQVLNLFGNGTVISVCEKYADCVSVNVI